MNVLLIMTDEHRRDAMGCAGHPIVKTPHLDSLARNGLHFMQAYCNSPLCVPSRASFVTGRYVHEIGAYDNDTLYAGRPESFGHYLESHGVSVTTIGKLHFQLDQDLGFSEQLAPRPIPGDTNGLYREVQRPRQGALRRFDEAGPGDWHVDATTRETDAAIKFLHEKAALRGEKSQDRPWVLWLNYLPPHFPLIAPKEYYDLYPESEVDLPLDYPASDGHPILEQLRDFFSGREIPEATLRRTRAAYYALCTYVDAQIGEVLRTLKATGLDQETLVIYTSDHGEPLGDHEMWWKCCMYEASVGVPLILSGPGLPQGHVRHELATLHDVGATVIDAVGLPVPAHWRGRSLLSENESERNVVFSEYHAHGAARGMFMIRKGRFKYVYYPENPAQLFDVIADPHELCNLAERPDHETIVADLHGELTRICDPDVEDLRAREDQRRRREAHEAQSSVDAN